MGSGDFEALGVRARLQPQIDALRKQVAAHERQLKEQARQIHDIQVYLRRRDALELDAIRAQSHVLKYVGSFVAQLNGKSHALDEAIREFNKFLDLPERSSKFLAIWDLSWNLLAVALPALRMTGALSQMEKDAEIATKAAEIFWKEIPKTARLVAVLPNAGDLATVVDKLNTARKNGEAAMSTQVNDLQKRASVTKGPVRELIQDANKAMELSNTVIDSLYHEFENRLLYLSFDVSPKESLFDYAHKMLSVPEFFTDDEIDRLSLKYKWFLVGYYAKQYVQV